jgi:DNA-binding NarL/FixJ family response regulator
VFVVDDHALGRSGLRLPLDAEPDFEIVGVGCGARCFSAARLSARTDDRGHDRAMMQLREDDGFG